MKNIILAIDFTEITETLVREASILARPYQAKLWLIHISAPEPDFVGFDVGPQNVRDQLAHKLREEHRELQSMAGQLETEGIPAEALLIQGPTVETLLDKAHSLDADLIVMGAHSRSRLFDKLLGTTWSDLVRQSVIPILIVPERIRND